MQTITCDVCKKKVDASFTGRNFFYYADFSVCESCKDSFELNVKNAIRGKEPYTTEWYEKYIADSLDKAVQRGRI